ncbi:unnamed protein product [Arabidopsis arenosa]|uniref:Uncharacterized protein n=1 Tax=Arabidopsis arenosa TaxID=38785 RepID=A0A8S2ASG3_ARAAE|nr:unnamed protein product [Arabidopsis arenosa]
MMRFLGNTVAKSCRKGRLQNRDFSSAANVTSTTTISKKIVEYCFKGAFCGVGYVFGGLTSTGKSKNLQFHEEMLVSQMEGIEYLKASLVKK